MIILICDCCNTQVKQGEVKTVSVPAEHGMVYVFDVGPCCLDKPFRVPPSARIVRRGTCSHATT